MLNILCTYINDNVINSSLGRTRKLKMDAKTDSEVTSGIEETYSLLNDDSISDRKSNLNSDISDCKDNEDIPELIFERGLESEGEMKKRQKIEEAINNSTTTLQTWKKLAIEPYGLVNDDLRKKIWPLLLGVDTDLSEKVPSLEELSNHDEYNQVVLDVNRSLKRFPPGIPYKQRVALQDQLTVLILRVIMEYPHLRYYQGYHDVAITFLLEVRGTLAFRIMKVLSNNHLRECMEPTMEKTSYTLNYLYAVIQKVDKQLYDFMDRAAVGTMFALPWYLTWFGHSLNKYRDVVRLYDFFLASPTMMPIYVAAALVIFRRNEIFAESCDMASIHCLLSQIPDDLDFEQILICASKYYDKYPPHKIEKDVKNRVQREIDQRRKEELLRKNFNRNIKKWGTLQHYVPHWLLLHYRNKYGILFATATILFGIYAYLRATEKDFSFFKRTWNS